eukprot:m.51469 g.51469  ORF g.51469 m.51469 type:complete len:96 (-) comp12625_c1_seq1:149-436(-)
MIYVAQLVSVSPRFFLSFFFDLYCLLMLGLLSFLRYCFICFFFYFLLAANGMMNKEYKANIDGQANYSKVKMTKTEMTYKQAKGFINLHNQFCLS